MRPSDAQDPTRPPCPRPHATPPLPAASTHVARCVAPRPSRRARRRRHRPTPPTARTALSIRRVHSPRATLSALGFPRQNARDARGASCVCPRAPQRLQRLRKRPQRSEPRQMCARAARGGRRSDIWRAGASRAEIALRETNRRWKRGPARPMEETDAGTGAAPAAATPAENAEGARAKYAGERGAQRCAEMGEIDGGTRRNARRGGTPVRCRWRRTRSRPRRRAGGGATRGTRAAARRARPGGVLEVAEEASGRRP